jgi:hypothetical protein
VVTKGRRVGITRGAAQAIIEKTVVNEQRVLWVDTIYSNIQRYIDLYFMPLLEQLPQTLWSWSPKSMQLLIGKSVIDFRSSDNPENMEGFGYHLIFLNEAGIILKNPDLFKKSILPMMMDYQNSILIAAGVPKGKKIKNGDAHPFYELWERSLVDSNYSRFKLSSYTNPFLNRSDVDEIAGALDEQTKLQEIYGEFIDTTDNPYLYAFEKVKHVTASYAPNPSLPIWLSFDFNIEPNSCVIGQQVDHTSGVIFDEVSVKGSTVEVCSVIRAKYGHWLNKGLIFVTGDATGKSRNAMSGELTNYILIKKELSLRDYNLKVRPFNMLLKSSRILCNSVLATGDIKLTESCKQSIVDCQIANVDGSGDLVKDTGLHKLDCVRYMIEAWFPDYLDKPHKYKKQIPVALSAIQSRAQGIMNRELPIKQK